MLKRFQYYSYKNAFLITYNLVWGSIWKLLLIIIQNVSNNIRSPKFKESLNYFLYFSIFQRTRLLKKYYRNKNLLNYFQTVIFTHYQKALAYKYLGNWFIMYAKVPSFESFTEG